MPRRVPPSPDQVRDLEVLLHAHHPLLAIETVEEDRVESLLLHVADRLAMPVFVWQPHKGLRRVGADNPPIAGTEDPVRCLAFIEEARTEALFHLRGFARHLDDATAIARVQEIHRRMHGHRGAAVITAAEMRIPAELDPLFTRFDLGAPTPDAYHRFVSLVLADVRARRAIEVDMTREDVSELLASLRGLTLFEVRKIITQAVVEDGRLSREDIAAVIAAKRRLVERSGVLEYFPTDHAMDEIAGLGRLKEWLQKRAPVFADPQRAREFGLTPPKGLMLIGVQGCGKSLCAKAVANEWRLPLVRLDPSRVYNKFFGESEKNLARAIRTAEQMAPVVLWIDEIEKAFGGGGGADDDGGTSQRVFGTFLAWMQEKKESVFVIATANDVSKLPPEMLRKGRFDEIFFVDLPDAAVRERIFAVHLARRGRDPARFDVARLAAEAEGFSGAEIEQAIVSALYTAFSEDRDLTTEHVSVEIASTVPLSQTMAEKIDALREWARDRAVPAER